VEIVSENRCFGGVQGVYRHGSAATGCEMTFGLYLPPQAADETVPLVWYLSGLTCTHENAMVKAGAQAHAAALGLAVAFPDTSPRGEGVADDPGFDLGQGAGFYVDATEAPWAPHFRMWSYLADELPDLLFDQFPLDPDAQAITGHSMGGHGALTLAMGHPGRFAAVSAFAPIAHPTRSDWGRRQFAAYLGADEAAWARHDATLGMRAAGLDAPVLIDQGADDQFLDRLMPEALAEAMAARRQEGAVRIQRGYDHSYFFVASFMGAHLEFLAEALGA
jgi:S-formylglutathione hydrolase